MKNLNNITRRINKLGIVIITVLFFSYSQVFAGEFPAIKKSASTAVELEMKIENWMMNLAKWKTSSIAALDVVDIEEELNIEEWMLDASSFNGSDYESELEVEAWMLDASDENWSVNEEEELEVEDWMTNLNSWK